MRDTNIDNILKDFNQISGMEIALIDSKLHTLYSQKCPFENFCSAIHKSEKCLELCKRSDQQAANSVFASGAPLLLDCPFGITEAVFPIIQKEKVVAFLLCSLGVENSKEADSISIKKALESAPSLNEAQLYKAISYVPHLDKKTMECYFGILKGVATHISVNGQFFEHSPSIGELVKRFINDNISKKITLSDLSYHVHFSKATLTQHFRREFGLSIVEYMTNKRINLSKKLLLTTDATLNEIAFSCGYDDTEYFSRTFKKFTGLPPATWRKKNLNND